MRDEERLDEVEQAVTRPVEILDREDDRTLGGRQLEGGPPGGEQDAPVGGLRPAGPDGRDEHLGISRRIGIAEALEPGSGGPPQVVRFDVVRLAEQPEQQPAHRPVRQALAVGQALGEGHDRVPG